MTSRTMKRVLVTGATGFIGTHLVRTLHDLGLDVVATDQFEPLNPLPASSFVQADLLNKTTIEPLFEGIDTVFHLAAIPSIARKDPNEYTRVNVQGSALIRSLAIQAGVEKIVHMSSSTVYGIPQTCPLPETAPIQPKNPYSKSKADAEAAICGDDPSAIQVGIIRPRVVVGPGRAGIFALLFSCLRKNLPIPLFGGGQNRFQFTAVEDLVNSCLLVAREDAPETPEIYNIGCDVNQSVREEIQELIEGSQSKSRIWNIPAKPMETTLKILYKMGISPLVPEQFEIAAADFVLDTSKAKKRLGFSPHHANSDGLVSAWHWWRKKDNKMGMRGIAELWQPRYQNALQKRGKDKPCAASRD